MDALQYVVFSQKSEKAKGLKLLLAQIGAALVFLAGGIALVFFHNHGFWSFIGAFCIVTGVQFVLWVLGLRSPFLDVEENPTHQDKGPEVDSIIVEAAQAMRALMTEVNSYNIPFAIPHQEEDTSRYSAITKEFLQMADTSSATFTLIMLCNKISDAFGSNIDFYESEEVAAVTMQPAMPREGSLRKRFQAVYAPIVSIKDLGILGQTTISRANVLALIDLGTRLIRLSALVAPKGPPLKGSSLSPLVVEKKAEAPPS